MGAIPRKKQLGGGDIADGNFRALRALRPFLRPFCLSAMAPLHLRGTKSRSRGRKNGSIGYFAPKTDAVETAPKVSSVIANVIARICSFGRLICTITDVETDAAVVMMQEALSRME
jgi:hypothetical protein